MNNHLLDLIKVGLGTRQELLVRPTDEEWAELMQECIRQSVIGIGWQALNQLPESQRPELVTKGQWYLLSKQVEEAVKKAEKAAAKLEKGFRADGMECCILKGQGVAHLYPTPWYRQCGDVDVWMSSGRKKVIEYVKRKLGNNKVKARIHHVEYPIYQNVTIEIHYWPMFMYSFSAQHRLEKWFKRQMPQQMNNLAMERPDVEGIKSFHCPTPEFNAVFMLTHVLRHLFEEGIGLRHLIDYYYVLQALPRTADGTQIREDVKQRIIADAKYIGVYGFLQGMMYVMREALGMSEDMMVCKDSTSIGNKLLTEIMYTGNFGLADTRDISWKHASEPKLFIGKFMHNIRLWQLCPREVLAGPAFRLWHRTWRTLHGYMHNS